LLSRLYSKNDFFPQKPLHRSGFLKPIKKTSFHAFFIAPSTFRACSRPLVFRATTVGNAGPALIPARPKKASRKPSNQFLYHLEVAV
jgi:hypothetical protein